MSSDHPAVRAIRRIQDAIVAREWQTVADGFADEFRYEDRRAGLQSSGGKNENIEQLRVVGELGLTRIEWETIETRGPCLALGRTTFHASDFTVAMLAVTETDADERLLVGLLFDEDNLAGARAEFDARGFQVA